MLTTFAPLLTKRVWHHVPGLMVGALLAPGPRTVRAALRVMGLAQAQSLQPYHRVLHRAVWSRWAGAPLLLPLRRRPLAPAGPWVMGWEDTLERRRGATIQAQGLERASVRSAHRHLVHARGWRWWRRRLVVPMPWAKRGWAFPGWPVLAPAARSHRGRGPRHKQRTAWARHRLLVVRRWVPARPLVLVPDRRGAVITGRWRLSRLAQPRWSVTRVRLDAARYDPALPRKPRQTGRPRVTGQRLPTWAQVLANPAPCWPTATGHGWSGEGERVVERVSATAAWDHAGMPPLPIRGVRGRDPPGTFEPQALRCPDRTAEPGPILAWFVRRWRLEVTWPEARAHLGLETPRPWHMVAIARTTPARLGRFSSITRLAGYMAPEHALPVRPAVWSRTIPPPLTEASAVVRQHLWPSAHVDMSPATAAMVEIPRARLNRLTDTLCYAA